MKTKCCLSIVGTLGVLLFVQPAPAQVPSSADRAAAVADAHAGRWDKAEPVLTALVNSEPVDVEATVLLAQRRLQQNNAKEAVGLLDRAAAAAPDRPDLYSLLGQALGQRINEVSFIHQALLAAKMRRAFEQSVKLDPNHLPGLIGLARYYTNAPAIAGGSVEKARTYAAEIEKRDTFSGALEFGMIDEHEQKWTEAIANYQKALSLRPDQAWLETMLGRTLAHAGRRDEARSAFETALKIQPDFAAAHEGLQSLQSRPADIGG